MLIFRSLSLPSPLPFPFLPPSPATKWQTWKPAWGLGSVVSSLSLVWDKAPATKAFWCIFCLKIAPGGDIFTFLGVYLGLKWCILKQEVREQRSGIQSSNRMSFRHVVYHSKQLYVCVSWEVYASVTWLILPWLVMPTQPSIPQWLVNENHVIRFMDYGVDWGILCLLAAYCGPNSPLAWAMGSSLCHGTTVNASQLPFPRL